MKLSPKSLNISGTHENKVFPNEFHKWENI